ncbi:hypothetical protein GCM10009836_24890 [Pseudonocardia ailaonensis]|uniref:NIPSNAP domain-containing protein n=1 Tax=Pseudonocardia ailaonensis TaxID=367279 RepID=A0ABN2MYI7_9PSEU
MSRVAIIDRITLAEDRVESWLGRLDQEYRPTVEERGAMLVSSWRRHIDGETIELCLVWECPDIAAFWKVRSEARLDPRILEWWAATDDIAISRDRKVYGSS